MDGVTPAMLKFAVSSFLVLSLLGVWSCQVGVGPDTRSDILQSSGGYQVQLIAGDEESGFQDGVGQEARLSDPSRIVVDSEGIIYSLENIHSSDKSVDKSFVRKITPEGVVSSARYMSSSTQYIEPYQLTLDFNNDLYLGDNLTYCWYKARGKSMVSQKMYCFDDVASGPYSTEAFIIKDQLYFGRYIGLKLGSNLLLENGSLTPTNTRNPKYTDSQGNYFTVNYLASTLANILMTRPDSSMIEIGRGRTSSSPSTPTPRATPEGCSSFDEYCAVKGYVDGSKETAEFHTPEHLVIGRDDTVYVSDTGNKKLRTIAPGSLEVGTVPLDFDEPLGDMALDCDGNIIAAYGNRIIKITLPVKAQQIP